jgi:hypothetical protein
MTIRKIGFLATCATVAAFGITSTANAQATRTWVSGVGDDVNPCSRTAPCKTFAGAISKTAAGGEINCLDPGGYGTLTITKSITVDCTGTLGSSLNSGGINGFVVNDSLAAAPGTSDVILRGLSINGAGTTPGLNGIRFISGRSIVVQDVIILNQKSGAGISIAPTSGNVRVHLEDVTVTNGGAGINFAPGSTAIIRAVLNNVRVSNNTGNGIDIQTPGTSNVTVAVQHSMVSNNNRGINANSAAVGSPARVMVADSTVSSNTLEGVSTSGPGSNVRLSNVSIVGNGTGTSTTGSGITNSYGNNHIFANTTNSAGTAVAVIPGD